VEFFDQIGVMIDLRKHDTWTTNPPLSARRGPSGTAQQKRLFSAVRFDRRRRFFR
jgi:hypothetical protein